MMALSQSKIEAPAPVGGKLWTLPARIEEKIQPEPMSGCWLWAGGTARGGYGKVWLEGRVRIASRAVYELLRGAVPPLLQLDHLCRNRICVNPDHLEPVTGSVNTLRGASPARSSRDMLRVQAIGAAKRAARTLCKHGHPFPLSRVCIVCKREGGRIRQRRYRANKRDARG